MKTVQSHDLRFRILRVSPEGVTTRDEMVFRFAREKNIPILMLTSGGYMKSNARIIADSITNLAKKNLIDLQSVFSSRA
ncbi:hypothetical protein Taro_030134 [Colocasia esculenta]|uniref:Histone deacetylase n=1 Tax=Colocasia esculenta TaxID=4460 RepID=A0A843VX01_COLES|nr:hypothetical protein [Colocasia esculenta]